MNLEPGECGMNSVSCGNGKLRQWLIDQIDSGKYPGLVWENDEKSIFRIPWKHAGKQDYNREEDAALFKVGLSRVGFGAVGRAGALACWDGSAGCPLPGWWPRMVALAGGPAVPCAGGVRATALRGAGRWWDGRTSAAAFATGCLLACRVPDELFLLPHHPAFFSA